MSSPKKFSCPACKRMVTPDRLAKCPFCGFSFSPDAFDDVTAISEFPNSPSNAGKWIDGPLSPANRNVDAPSGFGGMRRNPELQDMVRRVANGNGDTMQKIINKLLRLAEVERVEALDEVLEELSRLFDLLGYKAPKDKIINLFNRLSQNYDSSVVDKMKEILKEKGFTRNDKVIKLLNHASYILSRVNVKKTVTGKDVEKEKLSKETIEFLNQLVRVLPDISRNLNALQLEDEATRVRVMREDLGSIIQQIHRSSGGK